MIYNANVLQMIDAIYIAQMAAELEETKKMLQEREAVSCVF